MRHDLTLCTCGYPRIPGQPCTACAPERLPHVLVDTPANREALHQIAAQLYNALGEVQRQFAKQGRTITQSAALAYAETILAKARSSVELRAMTNAIELGFDVSPGRVTKALRAIGRRRKEDGNQKY